MAKRVLEAKRFKQIINKQMEILREETDSLKDGVDEFFNRVQSEVDTWINGGHVNQTTWAEMSNTIQQHITFLIAKSVELSGPESNESDEHQASLTGKSTKESPRAFTHCSTHTDAMHCCDGDGDKQGISTGENSSQIVTMRLAILEEAVFSLKKTTEKVQKDQEKVDTILKDFSSQQEHVNRKIKILDSNSKSQKILQEKNAKAEKITQANSLNINTLKESVKKHDSKLKEFEDTSKSVNISINELNKQIGIVKTLSECTSVTLQQLSKKVVITNQQMYDKINKIDNFINLKSSQYTEMFEDMRGLNQDKFEDLIGMVCQLLAKRLTPLETLNRSLNLTNIERAKEQLVKKESTKSRVEEMSLKISRIEKKINQPIVGFYARKSLEVTKEGRDIQLFGFVDCNFGGYFDQKTGIFTAPLNGLYLISINSESPLNINMVTVSCHQKNDVDSVNICDVPGNKALTRWIAMKAMDKLSLEFMFKNYAYALMWVHFSCFLITR